VLSVHKGFDTNGPMSFSGFADSLTRVFFLLVVTYTVFWGLRHRWERLMSVSPMPFGLPWALLLYHWRA
jgi:hypothetical protein